MAFSVYDSPNSWTHNGTSATRTYLVEWDGTGETNAQLARVALDTYLSGFAENVSTLAIRDLNADEAPEFDPLTERLLQFYLHGLPIQPFDCSEVEETEGKFYLITATWGSTNPAEQSNDFAATEFLGVATEDPDDKPGTFSTSITASIQGATIDFAPTIWAFVAQGAEAAKSDFPALYDVFPVSGFLAADDDRRPHACPFTLGSLVMRRPEADGAVETDSLTYSAPPIDLTLTFTFKGKAVKSAWVSTMQAAAKRGVMNLDAMTINGIVYPAYTLLLGQFDVSYENSGRGATTITVGFSTGYLTRVDFTLSAFKWAYAADEIAAAGEGVDPEDRFDAYQTDFFKPIGSAHSSQVAPFRLWSENPPTIIEQPGDDEMFILMSSLDFTSSFVNNYLLDPNDPLTKVNQREYIIVSRIWGEAVFGYGSGEGEEYVPGLFGTNTL